MDKEYQRQEHRPPYLATDMIIEYQEGRKKGIVLITRKNPPLGYALPGGFAEYDLSLEDNAAKETDEETGLELMVKTPEQPLCVHSNPDRDPRAHVISVTYVCEGYGSLRAGDDAETAELFTDQEVMGMMGKKIFAFPDHERILTRYFVQKGLMSKDQAKQFGVEYDR